METIVDVEHDPVPLVLIMANVLRRNESDPKRARLLAHTKPRPRRARRLGSSSLAVNSLHHQVIDRPGDRVRIVASNGDGHPEAIEIDGAPAVLGVQWHPELLRHRREQLALFQSLISRG